MDGLSKEDPGVVQTKRYQNSTERESSDDVELQELEKPVSDKWMGTESDQKDMRMLGRVQVLRVSYFFCGTYNCLHPFNQELTSTPNRSEILTSYPCWVSGLS